MSGSEGGFLDSGLACSFSRNSRSYCFLPSGFAGDHWPVNIGTTGLPLRHRCAAPYTLKLKVLGLDGSTGCTRVMWSIGTTSSVSKPTATLHIFPNFIWYTGAQTQIHRHTQYQAIMMSWCLMSSDVSWHIRDKLWPMPKHGSINIYLHRNQKAG